MQQTVLITGGSRGIGAAMARAFAAAGYAVAVNYHRSESEARALVEELSSSGYSVRAFQADVSDPGQALVEAAREADVPVEVIPGPSACVTALVSSGIPCEQFFFEGFLGRKHGDRVRRLQRLAVVPGALIFYESPHRIVATLEAVAEVFPQREVAVCRELTKLHEEVLRGPAAQLAEELRARGEVKGEIALVIAPPSEDEEAGIVPAGAAAADPDEALREDIRAALEEGEPASAVAKRLSQKYSRRKRDVYAMVLDMQ